MPQFRLTVAAVLLVSLLALAPRFAQAQTARRQTQAHRSTGPSIPHLPLKFVPQAEHAQEQSDASTYGEPILLPAPTRQRASEKRTPLEQRSVRKSGVTSVVLSSLAIVLGCFFLVVWLVKRASPQSMSALPTDVLEILGRSSMGARHHLQLIRIGRRLVLVSVTPDHAETLTEITDPDEVQHVTGLCQQHRPDSVTNSFRQVLHQLGTQSPSRSRRATARPQHPHSSSRGQALSLRQAREAS
jgi:flagellar biogenesis protein FliO